MKEPKKNITITEQKYKDLLKKWKGKIIEIDDSGYNNYPSKELLQSIKDFNGSSMNIMELVKTILENWNHGKMGYRLHKNYNGKYKLELHTLGWSGNEEIINEIINNIYLTHFHMKYYQWKTGGHYYFEIPIR